MEQMQVEGLNTYSRNAEARHDSWRITHCLREVAEMSYQHVYRWRRQRNAASSHLHASLILLAPLYFDLSMTLLRRPDANVDRKSCET